MITWSGLNELPVATFADDLGAITGLLWLVLAGIALVVVLPELRKVFQSRDFTIEVAGMSLSAQKASDELARQIEDLQKQVAEMQTEFDARQKLTPEVENGVDEAWLEALPSTHAPQRPQLRAGIGGFRDWPGSRPSVLWVDDSPENNAFLVRSLRDQGWLVELAESTRAALDTWRGMDVDVIISDLGRVEAGEYHGDAGLELMRAARDAGFQGPFIVFTSEARALRESDSLERQGATVVTASPVVLRRELEGLLGAAFERSVAATLERYDFRSVPPPSSARPQNPVDFFGEVGGQRIAVEAVRVTPATRRDRLEVAAAKLLLAANHETEYAEHLVVVTPQSVEPNRIESRGQTIRVLGVDEFGAFLASLTRS